MISLTVTVNFKLNDTIAIVKTEYIATVKEVSIIFFSEYEEGVVRFIIYKI